MEIPLPATASDPQFLLSGFSSWCPDAVLEAPKNQNPFCAATVSLEITHLDPLFAPYFTSTRKAFLALHEWPFHISNPWLILLYTLTHSCLVSIHVPPSSFLACLQASVCFFLSSSVCTTYYGSKEKKESQVCTTLLGWSSWRGAGTHKHLTTAGQLDLCLMSSKSYAQLLSFQRRNLHLEHDLNADSGGLLNCSSQTECGPCAIFAMSWAQWAACLDRFGSCFLLDDWKLTTNALF